MIPICLVTGFLGAGKTTLLQRIVEQLQGRRVLFLINEFSATDIDGQRLALPDGEWTSIAGGSIFCRCKVTDFIAVLRKAIQEQPEGIVIEASGIADPSVMRQMLIETQLADHLVLARSVCVVDPGSLPKVLRSLPNVAAQLRFADRVIVNKTDSYPPEEVERCIEQVRHHNATAVLSTTNHCRIQDEWLPPSETAIHVEGTYAPCRDPNYHQLVVTIKEPVDLSLFKASCAELGDALYRVKGTVPTQEGSLELDYPSGSGASGEWSQKALRQHSGDHHLVLIAASDIANRQEALAADLQQGVFTQR